MFARFGTTALLFSGLGFGAATDPRLVEAIKDGNGKVLESLLSQKADVNAALPDGSTPLAWAVYTNQSDAVTRLIKAGANVNVSDEYGDTPLTLSCTLVNVGVMQALIDAGADANAARWNGETALMIASRTGSVPGVKLLIDHGAKIDAVDLNHEQTALMWAAAEGHSDIVDLLLKSGADPKLVSKGGFNALVFAVQHGDAKSTSSLIAAGLSPDYVVPSGPSVLQIAVLAGKTTTADVLMKSGANVNIADKSGFTPLHMAAQSGNLKIVETLLAQHAEPNSVSNKVEVGTGRGGGGGQFRPAGEQTPLMLAARANKLDVMRALVAAGAKPDLKAQDGTTLLMNAASSGHVEAVKYVYELAPDIMAVTDRKSTVMHAAVTGSLQTSTQPEICKVIQFLADKGADLDAVNSRGQTPITIANVIPIDDGVTLLEKLIVATGKTPKQSTKR